MSDQQPPHDPADSELSDDLVAALRHISPVSDAVREVHIAAALAELSPRARRRVSPISVAASIILVIAVGATLFARTGKNATPVLAAHAISPYVPTKGATGEETDKVLGANVCWTNDTKIFGFYTMDTQPMKLGWQGNEIAVFNGDSCAVVGALKHPAKRPTLPKSETKMCAVSLVPDAIFIAETSKAGYSYQVLATNTELMLLDCATAAISHRIAHPNPEVPLSS